MKKNISKKEIIFLILIILIQTIIFVVVGMQKEYLHIDEAFSMGLTNYDHIKLQDTEGFYNTWHDGEYFKDYLIVNEDEKFDFSPVYENQKNDVHPPFYYLLLRLAMEFHVGEFSMWSGIILNIVIYVFVTIFMYLIMKKILEDEKHCIEKSAIFASVSSLVISSITNVMYIRMYALSALNVLITTYLHIKLFDSKETNFKLLFAIGFSALIGSLTHYYYLFYLGILFIMFVIKYIKEKRYKELRSYFFTMVIAAVFSLLIFPYSIKHLFFGYRGQGALSNMLNVSEFIKSIGRYLLIINRYTFNNLLFIFLFVILIIVIYKKKSKIKLIENTNKYIKFMIIPALVYFILVAISSPWKELRYIMPICAIIFIIVFYYLNELISNIIEENVKNIVFAVSFIIMLVMPFIVHIPVPVLYKGKAEIVSKVTEELNVPTLFWASAKNVRIQDDMLIFINLKDIYVAEGTECNSSNVQNIMNDKDLSRGIVVFLNDNQNKDKIIETIRNSLRLERVQHLKRMNACDIYYLK